MNIILSSAGWCNGAYCHSNHEYGCREFFGDRLKVRHLWPPQSLYLTPHQVFSRWHMWKTVSQVDLASMEHVRQHVTEAVASINRKMLKKVFRNTIRRLQACKDVNGAHIEHFCIIRLQLKFNFFFYIRFAGLLMHSVLSGGVKYRCNIWLRLCMFRRSEKVLKSAF